MEKKVYVPTQKNDVPKMHVKFDCCGFKADTPKVYVTEAEAREKYGAKEFCKKCTKPKSRKASTGQRQFVK